LVKRAGKTVNGSPARRAPVEEKDADTRALEGDLSAALKMRVTLSHEAGTESGQLTIRYNTLEELDTLCGMLSQN